MKNNLIFGSYAYAYKVVKKVQGVPKQFLIEFRSLLAGSNPFLNSHFGPAHSCSCTAPRTFFLPRPIEKKAALHIRTYFSKYACMEVIHENKILTWKLMFDLRRCITQKIKASNRWRNMNGFFKTIALSAKWHALLGFSRRVKLGRELFAFRSVGLLKLCKEEPFSKYHRTSWKRHDLRSSVFNEMSRIGEASDREHLCWNGNLS